MTKPERILTRHYKNGIINARADDDPWRYPPSSALIPAGEGEYIRADLGSFYQEKDIDALQNRIAGLEAENVRLREALIEAERYMTYFSGETRIFEGPGMPLDCLATIRAALRRDDGEDE